MELVRSEVRAGGTALVPVKVEIHIQLRRLLRSCYSDVYACSLIEAGSEGAAPVRALVLGNLCGFLLGIVLI